jgi:restriction endonuclease S subunit
MPTSKNAEWPKVKFGDVVRKVNKKLDPETSGLERYIAGEHMDTDNLRISRWGTIGDGYLGPAFTSHFLPGQVLYGSRRTYLRKVAVPDFEGICANTTFVLEPSSPELLQEFLPHVMSAESFHAFSIAKSKGSVNPYINYSDLVDYEFVLPPVEEQGRIAQVLASVDMAIDRLLSINTELLSRCIAQDGKGAKLRKASGTLGDAAEFINGFPFKPSQLSGTGMPVVRIKQLLDESEMCDLTDVDTPERNLLNHGDIVFSWSGTLALRTWTRGPAILNQHLFKVVPKPGFETGWVKAVLEAAIPDLSKLAHGSTMKHITKPKLLNYKIAIPDRAEQIWIAKTFERLQGLRSHLDHQVKDLSRLKSSLMSMMQEGAQNVR